MRGAWSSKYITLPAILPVPSVCIGPIKKILFTGDVIFKEAFGRTDLPGGDGGQLKESIARMSGLEVDWLLPGHGEIIAGAEGVRMNFDHLEQYLFKYI